MERIQKIIAESGYCSRRKAEEYIAKGQVKVNGIVVKELGTKASYDDEITINDNVISSKEEKEYYLLYKPEKTISSVKDEKDRDTVTDYIDTTARIYPVGRLDYNTTGIMLLTNDGELSNILTHPSHKIEKRYMAKVEGIITPEEFMKLKSGVVIDNRKVKPTYIKLKKTNKDNNTSSIVIGITEGRNHIIKRMLESVKHEVIKLKRESIGFLNLEGLKPGEYRKLSIKEVKRLYSLK